MSDPSRVKVAWPLEQYASGFRVELAGQGLADAPPPAQVRSLWETDSKFVSRDCGFSAKVPGRRDALWLFCDSQWFKNWDPKTQKGTLVGFHLGSTAAFGPFAPGLVPTGLTEVPALGTLIHAPNARPPSGFLPNVNGLHLHGSPASCNNSSSHYSASWISGVAAEPAAAHPGQLLITYIDFCVELSNRTFPFTPERFGVAEYDPATNRVTNLFARTGSNVTLKETGDTPAAWQNHRGYRVVTRSLLPQTVGPTVHVASYASVGHGFVIVEQSAPASGSFRIWESGSLASGWRALRTGSAPCSRQNGLNLCRAMNGHPELSTRSDLMISLFDPGDDHVIAVAVPW